MAVPGERERGINQRGAKVRVEGPSAFCSCNICVVSSAPGLHQHAPSPRSYYLSPEELHKLPKKIKYRVFSLRIFQLLVQEVLGFFPFHARNLLLCPPARCAIPVYVLGEQAWCLTALPTLPGCLGSSALCKGKYCLLPTQPLLQLMGSWEGCYILAGEVNQPEKQAELMDIQIIANVCECFTQ